MVATSLRRRAPAPAAERDRERERREGPHLAKVGSVKGLTSAALPSPKRGLFPSIHKPGSRGRPAGTPIRSDSMAVVPRPRPRPPAGPSLLALVRGHRATPGGAMASTSITEYSVSGAKGWVKAQDPPASRWRVRRVRGSVEEGRHRWSKRRGEGGEGGGSFSLRLLAAFIVAPPSVSRGGETRETETWPPPRERPRSGGRRRKF